MDLYAAESASDDFTRRRDHGKRIGIDLFYFLSETDRVNSVANGMDHIFFRTGKTADDGMLGHAVIKFADNEFGNFIGLIRNNDEVFTAVDIINNTVHEESFRKKTEHRIKTCADTERKE